METALAYSASPVLWLGLLLVAAACLAIWLNHVAVGRDSDIHRWAQEAWARNNELEYPSSSIGDGPLSLSAGYRHSRTATNAVSAVALAWSAGQADVETISVVAIGGLKVETAAIPLLLSAAILFSLIRSGLEFSMQPVEVRRWKLARWDFRMALSLSRGALLLLPAAMLHRSLATGLAVVAGLVLVTAMGHVFVLVATVAFTPVMVRIRARQGRPAGAARVFEAFAWASFAGLAALAVLCFGAVFFAIRSGLVGSYDPLVVALLSLNVLVVAYSLVSQRHYLELVFAVSPGATVHLGPEGNLEVHIHPTSDASLGQHQHRDDGGGPSNTKDRPWERPDGGG